MKNTVLTFKQAKQEGRKTTVLTCYDFTTASLMEKAGVECILVGDSLGNTMLGYPDTLSVTMEDMIHHCRAVARACENTFVLCDMPFMSYEVSVEEAVKNAGRLMKEGRANAVKLEGGREMIPQIKKMVESGIPVCGHIGLTPQSVNAFGGHKVQGKTVEAAKKLIADAKALDEAGVFAIVLECVPAALAEIVTKEVNAITIGIGAGAGCDGQVLVYQDMLAMGDFKPKFVKQFAQVGEIMTNAFKEYIDEVHAGAFPTQEHTFKIEDDVLDALKGK